MRKSEALEAAEAEINQPKETISQLKDRAENSEVSKARPLVEGQTSLFGDFTTKDGMEVDE